MVVPVAHGVALPQTLAVPLALGEAPPEDVIEEEARVLAEPLAEAHVEPLGVGV